jgi:hyperosmotically inducible periplasmic protein
MKKMNKIISCLAIFLMIAGIAACAPQEQRRATGEYIDDAGITTRVKSALAADDLVSTFDVSVETFRGTVQLSGFVDSENVIKRAGDIAKDIEGVQAVQNNLMVRSK